MWSPVWIICMVNRFIDSPVHSSLIVTRFGPIFQVPLSTYAATPFTSSALPAIAYGVSLTHSFATLTDDTIPAMHNIVPNILISFFLPGVIIPRVVTPLKSGTFPVKMKTIQLNMTNTANSPQTTKNKFRNVLACISARSSLITIYECIKEDIRNITYDT